MDSKMVINKIGSVSKCFEKVNYQWCVTAVKSMVL